MQQAQNPAFAGMCVTPRPEVPLFKGYRYPVAPVQRLGAQRGRAAARAAVFALEPSGGGSPPPRRAALERLVAEASARVRVVVAELRADGAEELEQHLRVALLAALSPDAGGPDAAA